MLNLPKCSTSDLSELIHVLKAVSVVTGGQLNLSLMFVDSHFLIAKVSPEWRLNSALATQKRCLFPLNRGVPSPEVTNLYTKIMGTFFWDQILCSLNGGIP